MDIFQANQRCVGDLTESAVVSTNYLTKHRPSVIPMGRDLAVVSCQGRVAIQRNIALVWIALTTEK